MSKHCWTLGRCSFKRKMKGISAAGSLQWNIGILNLLNIGQHVRIFNCQLYKEHRFNRTGDKLILRNIFYQIIGLCEDR